MSAILHTPAATDPLRRSVSLFDSGKNACSLAHGEFVDADGIEQRITSLTKRSLNIENNFDGVKNGL